MDADSYIILSWTWNKYIISMDNTVRTSENKNPNLRSMCTMSKMANQLFYSIVPRCVLWWLCPLWLLRERCTGGEVPVQLGTGHQPDHRWLDTGSKGAPVQCIIFKGQSSLLHTSKCWSLCPWTDRGDLLETVTIPPWFYVNTVTGTTNNAFESYFLFTLVKTQMQMYVCQTDFCDFTTWTPQIAVIFRVKRDDAFLTTVLARLAQFWATHIYPELRTRCRETKVKGKVW